MNTAIIMFNTPGCDPDKDKVDYPAAMLDLEDFKQRLNDQHNGNYYGPAIKAATIEPILSQGYIVAANVHVQWNGTHSDGSTIHP